MSQDGQCDPRADATGSAAGIVARHVGYQTPSAFVAAFRKETGLTPAAYFRSQPQGKSPGGP
jgi:AraC-like DNA-binding protein